MTKTIVFFQTITHSVTIEVPDYDTDYAFGVAERMINDCEVEFTADDIVNASGDIEYIVI